MGEMSMTVQAENQADILTAQDDITQEKSVQYIPEDLEYVTCIMTTPHPIVNMTPVV